MLHYQGHASMGRICDAMHLAVKPDHSLPPFVLSHPSSHRHRNPATLMESLPRLADWGLASALQSSAQPSKLFVAFGMFNGLISIFLLGNALREQWVLKWLLIAILNVNILIRFTVNDLSSLLRILSPLLQR